LKLQIGRIESSTHSDIQFLTAWRSRYSFTSRCVFLLFFCHFFFLKLTCFRNVQKFAEILQIYIATMYRIHFFEYFFRLGGGGDFRAKILFR